MYFNEMFLNKLRRRQGSTIPKHSEGAISWYALPAVPSIRFPQSECTEHNENSVKDLLENLIERHGPSLV